MKIRKVGTELLHADGQTERDMRKLRITFHHLAKAPKKERDFNLRQDT